MGFLFKIVQRLIVPLLFLALMRSFFADLFRRMGNRGGPRRDWQSGGENGRGFADPAAPGGAPRSPYEIFGLPRSAGDDEIRARYRELISKYHPDKFAGLNDPEVTRLAAKKFEQIQGAYEKLKRQRGM